jgi:hypothetical protein
MPLANYFKNYSYFILLQLKKVIKTPDFPPKKVLNRHPKVLEQRRQMFQSYLQVTVKLLFLTTSDDVALVGKWAA